MHHYITSFTRYTSVIVEGMISHSTNVLDSKESSTLVLLMTKESLAAVRCWEAAEDLS